MLINTSNFYFNIQQSLAVDPDINLFSNEMPNSEFDQDSDGSDDESSPPEPLLSKNEYVVARISVRKTLGAQFYVLGTYYKVPGTFPIDSREAASASWRLVDEFLEHYGFPCNEDVSEWSCPC